MLMVIFGAGASYDSVPAIPIGVNTGNRLPLAKDLFIRTGLTMQAMAAFPQCQALMPEFQNPSNNETVEQILQRLQEENHPLRTQQLAAVRFYLQFLITRWQENWKSEARSGTNYQVLLNDLQGMRSPDELVCLVTFNYDTMLEDAITSTLRMPIRGLGSYICHEHYKVIKLHGSVNWAREVHTRGQGTSNELALALELIDRIDELNMSQNYVMAAASPPGRSERNAPLFPAIAIPVERKNSYECPDDHVQALKASLPQISHLLIIGWRAAEEHFLTLLSEGLPNVRAHIVAGSKSDVDEIVDRLGRAPVRADVAGATVEGFTQFTREHRLRDFLRG